MEEKRNEVMAERKKRYKLCGMAKVVQRQILATELCRKGLVDRETKSNQLLQQIVVDVFMAATIWGNMMALTVTDYHLECCMVEIIHD